MKKLKYTYLIVLAALTAVMAACSSDEDTVGHASERADGKVPVRLHVRVAGQGNTSSLNTRATWSDINAQDAEMMNVWTVIAVHAEDDTNTPKEFEEGDIAFIHASVPKTGNREIDDEVYLKPGKYVFYSFANMDPGYITMNILGINDTNGAFTPVYSDGSLGSSITYSSDFFYDSTHNDVYLLTWDPGCKINLHEYYDNSDLGVAGKTVSINGNGFNPTVFNPANNEDNGFDSKGIPMSNVQEITITGNSNVDLIVVRMMAKMELQFYNETGKAFKVMSATLSDITQNSAISGNDNLKLLPRWTSATGMNNMDVVQHGDLQPNVVDNAAVVDVTFEPKTALVVPSTATYTQGTPSNYKMTFYINESKKPTNPEGLFYLTVTLQDENGENTELRYSLISSQSTDASGSNYKWDYIARNDYRIIPIVIDDYKLELIPYDFPPIGVYPCSVKEIGSELYEMTFHDYGHFHLVPRVTKISTSATVPFGTGDTRWTLMDGADADAQWAASWKTAATKGGAWVVDGNPDMNTDPNVFIDDNFYRDQPTPDTQDGDDAGGVPKWYTNTSSPQWDPAGGTNYNPFIFGYIAEPPTSWWEAATSSDRQIYHEFRVKLYVNGSYRRDLLYRFYMTLSKEQMLGARAATPFPSENRDRGHRPHNP